MFIWKTKVWMRFWLFLLLVIIFELFLFGTQNCFQKIKADGKFVQAKRVKLYKAGDEPCIIPSDEELKTLNETEMVTLYWRSNFQFSFEIRVREYLGCDVYTFDPSMDIEGSGQNRTIPHFIKFKEVGLAGRDYVAPNSWRMQTLKTTMEELGHENEIIDLLKIDIEGFEWEALTDIVESGVYRRVKQLLVEVHFGRRFADANAPFWGNRTMADQLRVLRMLYKCGFRTYMRERLINYFYEVRASSNNKIPSQIELSFANIAYISTKASNVITPPVFDPDILQ